MVKNLYDSNLNHVGTFHFMKNKNEYGIRFNSDNYFADVTLSIDAFPEYCKQFGFLTEREVVLNETR